MICTQHGAVKFNEITSVKNMAQGLADRDREGEGEGEGEGESH